MSGRAFFAPGNNRICIPWSSKVVDNTSAQYVTGLARVVSGGLEGSFF